MPNALSLILLLATAARAQEADPPVKTETGLVSGSRVGTAKDVRAYLGIPFSKAPVGALRWRPPEPPESWEGVRECVKYGPACPQPVNLFASQGGGSENMSEDCLYLNVWTTAPATTKLLPVAKQPVPAENASSSAAKQPVMVWIHGGGFIQGSGAGALYVGDELARRGVVVVTINYRLGPFGFLGHPLLTQESPHKSSGNYGLLDQIAALQWVRANIAAFGGDPDNVTVFGESAGSWSVGCLLIEPLAKGLFQRAIGESGAAIWVRRRLDRPAMFDESVEATGERVLKDLVGDAKDPLAVARAKSATELLAAAKPTLKVFGSEPGNSFGPAADGWVIPDEPLELFTRNRVNSVPVLIGVNADEGSLFTFTTAPPTPQEYCDSIRAKYGAAADKLLSYYKGEDAAQVARSRVEVIGDALFVAPTRAQVRALAGNGHPCFLYEFTRVATRGDRLGAFHSSEIPYVFGHLEDGALRRFVAHDRELSQIMMSYWVNFARSGDPNGPGLPKWPEYSREEDEHLEIGDEVRAATGLRAEACDLWDEVVAGWGAQRH